jgi:hypothetical protein
MLKGVIINKMFDTLFFFGLLYIVALVLSVFVRRYTHFLAPLIYSLLLSNYYMYVSHPNTKLENWIGGLSMGNNLFQLGEEAVAVAI